MSDSEQLSHDRATCPECGDRAVTIMVAPRKPAKMKCGNCGWDSLRNAADVLADMTDRDRSEFVPSDVEMPDFEDQEVE